MVGWVEASVSVLRCENAMHITPHLTFSSDTDMVTMGLVSLSSIAADEIVVAELLPTELADRTGQAVQNRVNQSLARNDLRFVQLLRVEQHPLDAGLSFQDFRKAYRAPSLIFACPSCHNEAVSTRTETPSEFNSNGGKLTILAHVEVRD